MPQNIDSNWKYQENAYKSIRSHFKRSIVIRHAISSVKVTGVTLIPSISKRCKIIICESNRSKHFQYIFKHRKKNIYTCKSIRSQFNLRKYKNEAVFYQFNLNFKHRKKSLYTCKSTRSKF